jgi:ribosome-associated protein
MEYHPPPYSTDPEVLAGEIEISVYRASGPGGQHRNKTESAVRIRHMPSGVIVVATENRSQIRNRQLAMDRLVERLKRLNHKPKRRKATRPTTASVENRLRSKKLQSLRKKLRGRARSED